MSAVLQGSPPNSDAEFGAFPAAGLPGWIIDRTRRLGQRWLDRRLAFALRRLAIANLNGQPVDTEALGARMRLYPYNNVCEKRILFTPQYFDAAERAALASRIRPGFVFLDIGSNIGGYALFVAALAGPGARILAIEPQPEIFERLMFNIRANGFGTMKAIDCAVADKDGEVTLFLSASNRGESSVKVVSGADRSASVKVSSKTLLTIVQDEGFERIDAAKLDTEGAEDLILETYFKSAPEALWPAMLILERGHGRWSIDLPALLKSRGYAVMIETRNNTVFERA
jgi:FkbM family methyltransferase